MPFRIRCRFSNMSPRYITTLQTQVALYGGVQLYRKSTGKGYRRLLGSPQSQSLWAWVEMKSRLVGWVPNDRNRAEWVVGPTTSRSCFQQTMVSPMPIKPNSSPQIMPSFSQASLNLLGGSVTSSKYWLMPPRTVP